MPMISKPRDSVASYSTQDGDTLAGIASKYPQLAGWQQLASFNWGTAVAREVNRALLETVGCIAIDQADASKTKLKKGAKILVPEAWAKDGFAVEDTHTIRIKPMVPAVAIGFVTLDPWFIPGVEACTIQYQLEGLKANADTVSLEVHGSNYCKCTDWAKGLGTYSALPDTPVFTKADGNKADERGNHAIEVEEGGVKSGWKGTCNAADGILSVKTDNKERLLNVAFSPYTVLLRYCKADDADKKARIVLEPFWPLWDETASTTAVTATEEPAQVKIAWTNAAKVERGVLLIKDKNGQCVFRTEIPDNKLGADPQHIFWDKAYREDAENSKFEKKFLAGDGYTYAVTTVTAEPNPDSLKITWEIKGTRRFERGLLEVTDGKGKVVFRKALSKQEVGEGEHEHAWDGKYNLGTSNALGGHSVIPQDMPYRVQVQAHTGIGQAKGLALAAMHTEVRLYVHPKTRKPSDIAYDPWTASQSLNLGVAPLVPGYPDKLPAEGDGTSWFQYKLAEYGFHPGPITGTTHDHYKLALKEFKRSVPADGSVAAGDFTRLAIDETESDETKTAINTIRDSDKRRWFGSLARVRANNDAPDLTDAEIGAQLADVAQNVIVWVEDRQYYTESLGETRPDLQPIPKDDNNANFLNGTDEADRFGLMNHRGLFSNGEVRVTKDSESVARPWIPLQVDLPLLGRGKGLQDAPDEPANEAQAQATRDAIGPLRVDWTFDELPWSTDELDAAAYDHRFTRSRRYVAWALDDNKGTHNRKDTTRDATYTNCKKKDGAGHDLGGIRPDALATYYKEAFGADAENLAPWAATAVDDTESTATVVHDHLISGQQADTDLFRKRIGTAGVYFHPSRIAGDGYRVRAEVQFKEFGPYSFPNLKVLLARYPTAPQAHSARLRLWRKTSLRGYAVWAAPTGHWPALVSGLRKLYRPAYVYFVHEGGAATTFDMTDVYDPDEPDHVTRFKKTVRNNVLLAFLRDRAKMSLKTEHNWPWSDQDDFGWPRAGSLDGDNDVNSFLDGIHTATWRKYREALLLGLLREVEKRGYLRGHLLVEFRSSSACRANIYVCDNPADKHRFLFLRRQGAPAIVGAACQSPGCAGVLASTGRGYPRDSLPFAAVGSPLGATWLFTTGGADVWAHELGHHRHLEHAAGGPGAKADYHDSEAHDPPILQPPAAPNVANQGTAGAATYSYQILAYDNAIPLSDLSAIGTTNTGNAVLSVTNFNRVTWTAVPGANRYKVYRTESSGTPGSTGLIATVAVTTLDDNGLAGDGKEPKSPAEQGDIERQWDRHCIMSYAGSGYPSNKEYFCGRCILRNRGWRVSGLGFPGKAVQEP